jgi:hypothetical protein
VSDLFPAVVKNVASKNIEVKKLVYVYLTRSPQVHYTSIGIFLDLGEGLLRRLGIRTSQSGCGPWLGLGCSSFSDYTVR